MSLKEFQRKYLRVWIDGCGVQKVFMVLNVLSLLMNLFLIVALWTFLTTPSPDDTEVQSAKKALFLEFRTRITIYILCTFAVNVFVQTIALNMFCRSSYNTNTGLSIFGYFLLFILVFGFVSGFVSLCFSPILLDFNKRLNAIQN